MLSCQWLSDLFSGRGEPINRKYIDLIYQKTQYWATYKPAKAESARPQVGDYGIINKKTGEFEYRGNIYRDTNVLKHIPELSSKEFQPQTAAPLTKWLILAKTANEYSTTVGPSVNLAGIVDASIDLEVSFKEGERGAFLAMHMAQSTDLPKDILLNKLAEIPELKKNARVVVTSVVSCPAFALQISDASASTVRLSLSANLPLPVAPAVSSGGEVGGGWSSEGKGALYQEGFNAEGKCVFTPLLMLRERRRGLSSEFRQSEQERHGDDLWIHASPPWGPLDNDGKEIAYDEGD